MWRLSHCEQFEIKAQDKFLLGQKSNELHIFQFFFFFLDSPNTMKEIDMQKTYVKFNFRYYCWLTVEYVALIVFDII